MPSYLLESYNSPSLAVLPYSLAALFLISENLLASARYLSSSFLTVAFFALVKATSSFCNDLDNHLLNFLDLNHPL